MEARRVSCEDLSSNKTVKSTLQDHVYKVLVLILELAYHVDLIEPKVVFVIFLDKKDYAMALTSSFPSDIPHGFLLILFITFI